MKTTHIGSLPFLNIEQALEYTFQFDIPAIPTLPKLNKNQYLATDLIHLLGLQVEGDSTYKISKPLQESNEEIEPFFLNEFLEKFKDSQKSEFKYQGLGPISFYKLLSNYQQVDFKDVYEVLLDRYKKVILKLKPHGLSTFFLDEPMLYEDFRGSVAALNRFVEELNVERVFSAVHCCGKLKPSEINQAQFPMSLDFNLYSREERQRFNNRIVPGVSFLGDARPDYFSEVQTNCYHRISPSCGLALKSLNEVEEICQNLNEFKA